MMYPPEYDKWQVQMVHAIDFQPNSSPIYPVVELRIITYFIHVYLHISTCILNDVYRTPILRSNIVQGRRYDHVRISAGARHFIIAREQWRWGNDVTVHFLFYHLLPSPSRHVVYYTSDRDQKEKEHENHVKHDEEVHHYQLHHVWTLRSYYAPSYTQFLNPLQFRTFICFVIGFLTGATVVWLFNL